mgnify:CR=1 FL=1
MNEKVKLLSQPYNPHLDLRHSVDNTQSNDGAQTSLRKTSSARNRKGVPSKFCLSQVIIDEEYLLSQTPSKTKMSSTDSGEKPIASENVQRWFNAEYFYSQIDRAYFASSDFTT